MPSQSGSAQTGICTVCSQPASVPGQSRWAGGFQGWLGGVALGPCAAAMAAGAELLPGPFPSPPGWFWVRVTMPEQEF